MKVRNVNVFGLEDFIPKVVKLRVNYYDNEPSYEHIKALTDLCDGSKQYEKELVEKAYNDIKQAFIEGAKWADKTMIDKACEWLNKGGYFVNNKETLEDFRKAMEE